MEPMKGVPDFTDRAADEWENKSSEDKIRLSWEGTGLDDIGLLMYQNAHGKDLDHSQRNFLRTMLNTGRRKWIEQRVEDMEQAWLLDDGSDDVF